MTHNNTISVVCTCFHVRMLEKIYSLEPNALDSKKSRLEFLHEAIKVAGYLSTSLFIHSQQELRFSDEERKANEANLPSLRLSRFVEPLTNDKLSDEVILEVSFLCIHV